MDFSGKRVLISDIINPICTETAKLIKQKGGMVFVNANDKEAFLNSPAFLENKDFFSGISIFGVNTSSESGAKNLVGEVINIADKLDYFVHGGDFSLLAKMTLFDFDFALHKKIMDNFTKSAFFLGREAGEQIALQGGGAMVFLGSVHSEKPTGAVASLSMASGAVKMMVKEMGLFFGRKKVRVNYLQIGALEGDDDILESDISGIYYDYLTKTPYRRPGYPSEAASAAAAVLSDSFSLVNGADITVDGGFKLYYIDW